jgi:regulator of protease activity HflC (stomatin/prohibitin superfamily)
MKKFIIILGVIVALLAASAGFCAASVPTGYTGILTTFGKVENTTLEAGFHFKSPFQKVVLMDNREQRNALRTVAEPTNEAVKIVSSRRAAWRGSRVEQHRDHAATRDGSVRLALLARDASRS